MESIVCPRCGKVSHNKGDIEGKYCAMCHLFHDQMTLGEVWWGPWPPQLAREVDPGLRELARQVYESMGKWDCICGGRATKAAYSRFRELTSQIRCCDKPDCMKFAKEIAVMPKMMFEG